MEKIELKAMFQRFIDIIKRRIELTLIPPLFILPVCVFLLFILPKKFKSQTKVVIEEARDANPFLQKFTTATRIKKRIVLLKNIVTSHKVLGQIVDKNAKNKGVIFGAMDRYYAIQDLRSKIDIYYLGQGLVELSFFCRKPQTCLDNLNFVFDQFVTETLRPQSQAVQRSSKFLDSQIKRLRHRLKETEETLTQYKQKHSLELPETYQINLNSLDFNRKKISQAKIKLAAAAKRRDYIYQKLRFQDPTMAQFQKKRTSIRIKISKAKALYTKLHPKTQKLQAQLKSIDRAIARHKPKKGRSLEEIEKSMRWGGGGPNQKSLGKGLFVGKLTPFERLQENLMTISVLKNQISEYEVKIKKIQKRIAAFPERERKLDMLKREASISRKLYVKLRSLYEESLLRRELELFDSSHRIQVIEPAVLPLFPISPRMSTLLGGGLAASIVLAIFLIAVAEIFDPSIKSAEEAIDALGLDCLGSFSIPTDIQLFSRAPSNFQGNEDREDSAFFFLERSNATYVDPKHGRQEILNVEEDSMGKIFFEIPEKNDKPKK